MLTIVLISGCIASGTHAASEELAKIETATRVFREIIDIPESTIPKALMERAQALAVIPGVIKAGLIAGGRHGTGIMVVRTEDGIWSSPAFISLTGLSLGWQAGVKSTDLVLVFTDRSSVDSLLERKIDLGAQASVAAGPVGRSIMAGTSIDFKSPVYAYSRSEGIFAGVSLGGAVIEVDIEANETFYDSPGITPRRIFSGELAGAPPAAIRFACLVAKHNDTTQQCA